MVYGINGIFPTVCACTHGYAIGNILVDNGICIDDTQGFDGVRFYNGYVPTLRSQRSGLKVVID